jgi:hypothetical protein
MSVSALRRFARRLLRPGLLREVAGAGADRRALLLYSTRAFRGPDRSARHQNVGQQRELARALGESGYAVDVVDFDETRRGLLTRDYDLVIDLHPRRAPLYQGRLRPGAVRIAYLTGSDPAASAAAEARRIDELARRRGVRLRPRRAVEPVAGEVLEGFDACFLFGDAVTRSTYEGARLPPTYALPNNGYAVEPTDPARRDPGRFLFLGSVGQVHKGLDLLLEVVAAEPTLTLEVCCDLRQEPDFVQAYRRELTATPNLRNHGFVDVTGTRFRELQARCGALVLPSCSEGQSGSVTVAMGYGLPCVLSRWCGFDHPELTILPEVSPAALRSALLALAARTPGELAAQSAATLALFQRAYRPEHYAAAVRAALRDLLGRRGGRA